MLKKTISVIAVIVLLFSISGCNFSLKDTVNDSVKDAVEGQEGPTLPNFSFSSELICIVDGFEGDKCSATVMEDNGTYDEETSVLITYESVAEGLSLTAGDYITFKYRYTTDVSAIDGTPHIKTEEITILPEYTPPETTAETTEETTEETSE